MHSQQTFPQNTYHEQSAPRINTQPQPHQQQIQHYMPGQMSLQQMSPRQLYSPAFAPGSAYNTNFWQPYPPYYNFNMFPPHTCNNTLTDGVISVQAGHCVCQADSFNGQPTYFPYFMTPATSPVYNEFNNAFTPPQPAKNNSPLIVSSSPTVIGDIFNTAPDPLAQAQQKVLSKVGHNQGVNVHIGNLPVDTTDEQLLKRVSLFGRVISSKAIIDKPNGVCKGYGFALFPTLHEATQCMYGLQEQGLMTSIAKDSFNGKLKEQADPTSTNLYVSNLPMKWTQTDVENLFADFDIKSIKCLPDGNGDFRGVAFVRFDTRDVCDKVIEYFNYRDLNIESHSLLLQVRYADTVEQKHLKRQQKHRVTTPLHHGKNLWKAKGEKIITSPPSSPGVSTASVVTPALTCDGSVSSRSSAKDELIDL